MNADPRYLVKAREEYQNINRAVSNSERPLRHVLEAEARLKVSEALATLEAVNQEMRDHTFKLAVDIENTNPELPETAVRLFTYGRDEAQAIGDLSTRLSRATTIYVEAVKALRLIQSFCRMEAEAAAKGGAR